MKLPRSPNTSVPMTEQRAALARALRFNGMAHHDVAALLQVNPARVAEAIDKEGPVADLNDWTTQTMLAAILGNAILRLTRGVVKNFPEVEP